MTIFSRRAAPSVLLAVVIMLTMLMPGMKADAESATDTGTLTLEIVPPGSSDTGTAASEPRASGPGTLSAFLMWMPDPADGQNRLHGMIAVQDHRASADEWTVRLMDGSEQPAFLMKVTVGNAGFGLPDWVYQGIFAWDVAVGASLAEAPQIVTAPQYRGYNLTIHQIWIDVDPTLLGQHGAALTLLVMLPSAP